MRQVTAGVLSIAYQEAGPPDGWPVVLLHGFPYSTPAYAEVAPLLAAAGARVITPWLRGYGPTRFLSPATPRSGQQAALALDLLALLDALNLPRAVLAGYDWGGRAACILAALWPERVAALVSAEGYNIQDIPHADAPAAPAQEHRLWYQYYFHTARGQAGLEVDRAGFCRLLWRLWSPPWDFDDATFAATAKDFQNPDFVEVVIHSYRHRYGLVAGDPTYEATEVLLATQPRISVPSVLLYGEADGVASLNSGPRPPPQFIGATACQSLPGIGHNIPQEAPHAFAEAVLRARALGLA